MRDHNAEFAEFSEVIESWQILVRERDHAELLWLPSACRIDIVELTDADLGSTVFSTYFLNTSLGPIGPAPDEAVAAWQNIPTFFGNVTVTNYTDVTFQAKVVPEPSRAYI